MENSRVDQILDGLNVSVLIIDANREITFANRAARKRFGESIVGDSFVRIIRQPDCLAAIDAVMNDEGERRVEITVGAAPSTTYEVNVTSVGHGNANDTRISLTFEDVSQIRDAQLMRSEFVANVSHELRSPLTALAGFIETLSGPAKDDADARHRFLGLMEKEAGRMKRLIDDLLSLSKLQSKERIRPSGRVDVHVLMQRVIATLIPISKQEQKNIDFKNNSKSTTVLGNEDELIQIFHNLIENAIKYGALETEVSIEISDLDHVAGVDGKALAVSVTDHGAGIAAEDIPRLTERFYRADKSRSRIKGGTGLGLAIVKHILNRHRGRLRIESKVGVGSTFTIFLPIGEK